MYAALFMHKEVVYIIIINKNDVNLKFWMIFKKKLSA